MTLPQQPAGAGVAETSPSTPNSQTQKEQSSPTVLSWAERASRAAATVSNSKPPKGPPTGAPKGPSKENPNKGKPPLQRPPADSAAKKTPAPSLPAFAQASKDRPVIVLDAGALMRVDALDRYREKCTFITTAEAAQEVRDAMARQRIESRFLDVHTLEPSAADRSWAEKFADMTGDLPFLSHTDLGLIALTYMLQRTTGQIEHLNTRPPAFEFFNEAALMQKLESGGVGRHAWTLQHSKEANTTSSTAPNSASDTNEKELDPTEQVEENRENESLASDEEDSYDDDDDDDEDDDDDDDMDPEEGWVTEEVLREHLGLAVSNDSNNTKDILKTNDADESKEGDSQELDNTLSKAFNGLDLRADMQQIEDLVSCMTTDFSMQNVLLQMGLKVLAVDGRKIRTVKIWALLCR
ncbi:hypothetical protein, conserved [Eimeria praecox]|uniref:Ribonuclease PIN domain-containing protein n=1 Tax=Eimeria praecox TaxID=51316 RepID=U6G668_9EIME|nr:hypothetical protein, conserved [Eimeria praecox]